MLVPGCRSEAAPVDTISRALMNACAGVGSRAKRTRPEGAFAGSGLARPAVSSMVLRSSLQPMQPRRRPVGNRGVPAAASSGHRTASGPTLVPGPGEGATVTGRPATGHPGCGGGCPAGRGATVAPVPRVTPGSSRPGPGSALPCLALSALYGRPPGSATVSRATTLQSGATPTKLACRRETAGRLLGRRVPRATGRRVRPGYQSLPAHGWERADGISGCWRGGREGLTIANGDGPWPDAGR